MADDDDDKAANEDGESKNVKTENLDEEKKEKKSAGKRTTPGLATKALRVFLFATIGTFLACFLFGDPIPNGLRVDFDLAASIKLGLIAGVISAVLRALVGMLPVFPDD